MRLPRFRLRTLLIAVAVAAVAIGGEVMRRRWSICRGGAAFHAQEEKSWIELAETATRTAKFTESAARYWRDRGNTEWAEEWGRDAARDAKHAADLKGIAASHGRMRRMFERAALRPWAALPREPERPMIPDNPVVSAPSDRGTERPEPSPNGSEPPPSPESVPIPTPPAGSLFDLKPGPDPPPP
jgi:hypothetical protein